MKNLKPVFSIKEGVVKLLEMRELTAPDFDIIKKDGEYAEFLVLSGKEIPLLFWRHEPRIDAMRGYGSDVADNSALNVYSFVGRDTGLDAHIFKELDLSEYILNSKIEKVTAFINGGACNLIARTESGALANLELGNTMAEGTQPQFSHRLVTKRGMASDRTVNHMTEPYGVTLFSACDTRPFGFDDADHYLLGLTPDEAYRVTFIRAIIAGDIDADRLCSDYERLKSALNAVYLSAKRGESVSCEVRK